MKKLLTIILFAFISCNMISLLDAEIVGNGNTIIHNGGGDNFGGGFGKGLGVGVGAGLIGAMTQPKTVVIKEKSRRRHRNDDDEDIDDSSSRKRNRNDDVNPNVQKIAKIFDTLTDEEQANVIKYARKMMQA